MRSLKPFFDFEGRERKWVPSGGGAEMGRLAPPPSDLYNCKLALAGLRQCNFIDRYARQTPHFGNAPRRHPLPLTGYWEGTAAAGSAWG